MKQARLTFGYVITGKSFKPTDVPEINANFENQDIKSLYFRTKQGFLMTEVTAHWNSHHYSYHEHTVMRIQVQKSQKEKQRLTYKSFTGLPNLDMKINDKILCADSWQLETCVNMYWYYPFLCHFSISPRNKTNWVWTKLTKINTCCPRDRGRGMRPLLCSKEWKLCWMIFMMLFCKTNTKRQKTYEDAHKQKINLWWQSGGSCKWAAFPFICII